MKQIEFIRSSTPENPALGYGDHVLVYEDNANIYGGHCSTCPNPFRHSDNVPWNKCFAMLAPQPLQWECVADDPGHKFGKCLQFNGGGRCVTVNANVNHDGAFYAEAVYCHAGGLHSVNPDNRGSVACFTIPPADVEKFFALFQIGEKGTAVLRDLIQNKETV
jgi:hypothetical protein